MGTIQPLKILKDYREKQDPPLSQGELADRLDVARETVARWEAGTRKPDEVLLSRISKETGISPSKLRPDLAKRSRLFAGAAA